MEATVLDFTPQWHSFSFPIVFLVIIHFCFSKQRRLALLFFLSRLSIFSTEAVHPPHHHGPMARRHQQRRRAHSHWAHHQNVLANCLVPVYEAREKTRERRREAGQHTPKRDSLAIWSSVRECGWAPVIDSAMFCRGMSSRAGSARLRVGWIDSVPASQLALFFPRFSISLLVFFSFSLFAVLLNPPAATTRPSKPSVAPQTLARARDFGLEGPSLPYTIHPVNFHLSASCEKTQFNFGSVRKALADGRTSTLFFLFLAINFRFITVALPPSSGASPSPSLPLSGCFNIARIPQCVITNLCWQVNAT